MKVICFLMGLMSIGAFADKHYESMLSCEEQPTWYLEFYCKAKMWSSEPSQVVQSNLQTIVPLVGFGTVALSVLNQMLYVNSPLLNRDRWIQVLGYVAIFGSAAGTLKYFFSEEIKD
ncbi:MAG: hypothetical protein I8H75_05145 [Myxococcaceae bacterium]|nr:hypothetical protein [Myxococcaceae bacterium]MBH2006709.1 hypothetical protein [Myxococcaceae bacterium]